MFWFPLLAVAAGLGNTACSGSGPASRASAEPNGAAEPPHIVAVSSKADIEPLYAAIGSRRFVLLGESTHGTHEYYHWRDRISRRLIGQRQFRFVAVEGDWEAIWRLNRYVKHACPHSPDARTALRSLDRWPVWMWANEEFADFLDWLREMNAALPETDRVGVYGLDMQDPESSMNAVVEWFRQNDPDSAPDVEARYRPVREVPGGFRRYTQALAQGGPRLQEDFAQVAKWLRERKDRSPEDASLFSAKLNALAVKSAEAQSHAMLQRGSASWNVRVRHMQDAFQRLAVRYGAESRGIVWAHNTHVGDASATDMASRGEINLGYLLRREFGPEQVFILGFSTFKGTVLAGSAWAAPMQTMAVIPAREGSLEAILHAHGLERALLFFGSAQARQEWNSVVPHRAIGVVYRPPHEAYVPTVPAQRYDALFFIRETRALTPLS